MHELLKKCLYELVGTAILLLTVVLVTLDGAIDGLPASFAIPLGLFVAI